MPTGELHDHEGQVVCCLEVASDKVLIFDFQNVTQESKRGEVLVNHYGKSHEGVAGIPRHVYRYWFPIL